MNIYGLAIHKFKIKEVRKSSTTSSNGESVVNEVYIEFEGGITDKYTGYINLERKDAEKLIKELNKYFKKNEIKKK